MWQRNTSTRYYVSVKPLKNSKDCVGIISHATVLQTHRLKCFSFSSALLQNAHSMPFQVKPSTMESVVKGLYSLRPGEIFSTLGFEFWVKFLPLLFINVFCFFCPQIGFLAHRLCSLDSFLRFILQLLNLSSRFTLLKTKNCRWSCRRMASAGNAVKLNKQTQ